MSQLFVYHTSQPIQAIKVLNHFEDINSTLAQIGVRFEQWQSSQALSAESSADDIIAAYSKDLTRLKQAAGYKRTELIQIDESQSGIQELRNQYLTEHTFSEAMVRFVVSGRVSYSLHIDEHIYVVLCAKGALISVPAGIKQWSDIGEQPRLTALRLFNSEDGLVAKATGENTAQHYPTLDDLL